MFNSVSWGEIVCYGVFGMIQGLNPFTPKIIANSPYGLPYNSYHVSLENLVLLSTTNTVINILFISHPPHLNVAWFYEMITNFW